MPSELKAVIAGVIVAVLLIVAYEWWEYKKCASGHYTCIVRG